MAVSLWRDLAACQGVDPKIWAAIERSVEDTLAAYVGRHRRRKAYSLGIVGLNVCASCPVRQQCLDWAKEDKYTGIAGGWVVKGGSPLTPPR